MSATSPISLRLGGANSVRASKCGTRPARILLCASLLLALPLRAADPAPALAGLTYSGDHAALESLDREIIDAGTDPQKLGAIKQRLLALLRLSDATFAARQAAAHRLGRVLAAGPAKTSADALKPLGAMLSDDRDSDLARLALERVRGDIVDALFVNALAKASGRTRLGVLDSIARRRVAAAVPPLSKLLQDSDAATVAAAARALGEIANPAAVAALHALPEPTPASIAAAKLVAAAQLPTVPALGLLNELQRSARDPVHRAAAFRLSLDIEIGAAAARIADVLGSHDWLMKHVALESLATSRAPNLLSTLAGKLSAWDAPTQRAVISALGRRGEASVTEAIVTATRHPDADVRAEAIEALGKLPGTSDTAVLLAKITAHSDSTDARIARRALARLNGPDVSSTILTGAERGETAMRVVYLQQLALRNMTEGLPLLRRSRADPALEIRLAAAGAIGEIAPVSEQAALLDWTIKATDPSEQTRTLRSLVNVTLRNPDEPGRGRAVFAAIESAPPELALRLLPALGRMGGAASAESAARLAIQDHAEVSTAATTALTRWPDATALPSLATVAEKAAQPEARTAATEGVLDYFERNRETWTPENTAVISRLLANTREAGPRRKLVALLHRADDRAALALARKLKSDPVLGPEATLAVDVIRANRTGPPGVRASSSAGIANLTDGKTNTRWTTPARGDEWFEADFRLSRPIVRVTLDQTGRAAEFPERYEVYVTDDPKSPGEAIATGAGQHRRTVMELPAGTRGRYLIVKNVAERDDTPWAVCELYVD